MFLIATCLSPAWAEAGVQLVWDASTSSNITGYRLSYGTTSHQYTVTIDVGNVTAFEFLEPNPSVTYFLAVRSYNTDGLASAYSNEISTAPAQPLRVIGISSSHKSPQVTGTQHFVLRHCDRRDGASAIQVVGHERHDRASRTDMVHERLLHMEALDSRLVHLSKRGHATQGARWMHPRIPRPPMTCFS